MNQKRVLVLFVLTLFIVNLLAFSVAAQSEAKKSEDEKSFFPFKQSETARANADKFFSKLTEYWDLPVIKQLVGILFGIWDINDFNSLIGDEGNRYPGPTAIASLIIFIVTWMIMLLLFKGLLEFGPFNENVTWFLSIGLIVIASQLGWVVGASVWAASIAAVLASGLAWLQVIIFLGLFILAAFGSNWLSRWSLHMRMAKEAATVEKNAGETKNAIQALREAGEGFKKSHRWGGFTLGQ